MIGQITTTDSKIDPNLLLIIVIIPKITRTGTEIMGITEIMETMKIVITITGEMKEYT